MLRSFHILLLFLSTIINSSHGKLGKSASVVDPHGADAGVGGARAEVKNPSGRSILGDHQFSVKEVSIRGEAYEIMTYCGNGDPGDHKAREAAIAEILPIVTNTGNTQGDTRIHRFWTSTLRHIFNYGEGKLKAAMSGKYNNNRNFFVLVVGVVDGKKKVVSIFTGIAGGKRYFANIAEQRLESVAYIEFIINTKYGTGGYCSFYFSTLVSKLLDIPEINTVLLHDESKSRRVDVPLKTHAAVIKDERIIDAMRPDNDGTFETFLGSETFGWTGTSCYLSPARKTEGIAVYWYHDKDELDWQGRPKPVSWMAYSCREAESPIIIRGFNPMPGVPEEGRCDHQILQLANDLQPASSVITEAPSAVTTEASHNFILHA